MNSRLESLHLLAGDPLPCPVLLEPPPPPGAPPAVAVRVPPEEAEACSLTAQGGERENEVWKEALKQGDEAIFMCAQLQFGTLVREIMHFDSDVPSQVWLWRARTHARTHAHTHTHTHTHAPTASQIHLAKA